MTIDPLNVEPSTVVAGPLHLDFEGFTVSVHGRDVALTLTEFVLLAELVRRRGVVRRETLHEVLQRLGVGRSRARPSPRSVDLHISRLRHKLGAEGSDCICTMRYVGYRFVSGSSSTTVAPVVPLPVQAGGRVVTTERARIASSRPQDRD
jgi:DNA-binding response OmpR family regulator